MQLKKYSVKYEYIFEKRCVIGNDKLQLHTLQENIFIYFQSLKSIYKYRIHAFETQF